MKHNRFLLILIVPLSLSSTASFSSSAAASNRPTYNARHDQLEKDARQIKDELKKKYEQRSQSPESPTEHAKDQQELEGQITEVNEEYNEKLHELPEQYPPKNMSTTISARQNRQYPQ